MISSFKRPSQSKLLSPSAISILMMASLSLTGCRIQNSDENNFRASNGGWWIFGKDYAALLFLPFAKVTNKPSQDDFRFCSYYVKGDPAKDGEFDYLNLKLASEWSPSPFSVDSLFTGMQTAAQSNERLQKLTLNWASGSASMAGDFLSEHKGKIDATVVATAVAVASATVACVLLAKSKATTCSKAVSQMLPKIANAEALKVGAGKVIQNKQVGSLARKILESRKLQGLASFLTFSMSFMPSEWTEWLTDNNPTPEETTKAQMDLLEQTLGSEAIEARAKQRLDTIISSFQKVPEEIHWDDLQTITALSMGASKRESENSPGSLAVTSADSSLPMASCPKPSDLNENTIKEHFELDKGWATKKGT